MLVTAIAILCNIATCKEVPFADSDMVPGLTLMACQLGAQIAVADWKGKSPYAGDDWLVRRVECRVGTRRKATES